MIEIIRAIAEPIVHALSRQAAWRAYKERKASAIGSELLLLYSAVNEILVTGRDLVAELERAAKWMQGKLAQGEPDAVYHHALGDIMELQAGNVLRLAGSVKRLGLELQVIPPEAYVPLVPLIHGKINAVVHLANALRGGRQHPGLLSVDPVALAAVLGLVREFSPGEDATTPIDMHVGYLSLRILKANPPQYHGLLVFQELGNANGMPAHAGEHIRHWLDDQGPADQLDRLEQLAQPLHAVLAEHFTLQDCLPEVGDRRAGVAGVRLGF